MTVTGTQAAQADIISSPSDTVRSVGNAPYMTVAMPEVFVQGKEYQPFSLEIWFKPGTFGGKVSLLSHYNAGVVDGLYFDGDNIVFEVDYTTAASAKASWYVPDFTEVWHVVATYDAQRLQLYVNKVLVAETELTDAQKADTFASTSNVLNIGNSAVAGQVVIWDAPAIYNRTISQQEVEAHFDAGRDHAIGANAAAIYDGAYWYGTDGDRLVDLSQTWSTHTDFSLGDPLKVSTINDELRPMEDESLVSMAGDWIGSFGCDLLASTLQGVKAEWNGDGAYTVTASLDGGTTWTSALTNGSIIPGTLAWAPTQPLLIKVSFTGGLTSDPAVVRDIKLTTYTSTTINGSDNSRILTVNGAVSTSSERNEPIEYNDMAGFNFNGGYLTLAADANDQPQLTYGIGAWVKWSGTSGTSEYVFGWNATDYNYITSEGTLTRVGTATEMFVNGQPVESFVMNKGVYYYVFVRVTAGINTDLNIGADYSGANTVRFTGQIGFIDLYRTSLTNAQIAQLYSAFFGPTRGSVVENSVMAIAENNPVVKVNQGAWAVSSSS